MVTSSSERRQIENEMIFRRRNERVSDSLGALDEMHKQDGNAHLIHDEDLTLQFMCECSDENCSVRIPLKLSEYQAVHSDRNRFILLPGHQVDAIEVIVKKTTKYSVVLKNKSIAEPSGDLNDTDIDNA